MRAVTMIHNQQLFIDLWRDICINGCIFLHILVYKAMNLQSSTAVYTPAFMYLQHYYS